MPTYEIKAPDGKTYQIDGPAGATEEQVRQKVLEFHPEAGTAPKPSWLERHGRDLSSGAGAVVGAVLAAPEAAVASVPTLGIGGLATEAAGAGLGAGIGGQLYDLGKRVLGHPENQTAGQRVAAALQDVGGGAASVPAARMIGAVAAPAAKATGKALADVWRATPGAQQAVASVRAQAVAKALEESQAARSAQTVATTQAARAAKAQQTAQVLAASPKPIGVGAVAHLSEQGAPVQAVAKANLEAADAARDAAYQQYTSAIDDVVKAKEAKGRYINDTPGAQSLLKEAADQLTPAAGSAPTTAPRPTTGQVRAYRMVQDALDSRPVELTPAEATEAKAKGYKVDEQPSVSADGETPGETRYFRTFKSPLEAVQNLRRWFGDAAYGKADISGFDGVNASTFRELNAKLGNIEDQFTEGLTAQQRASYKEALTALDKFHTGVGKKITATEGETEVSKLPAAKIPGAITSGGADTFAQFKAITNPQVASKFANDAVETALHDPLTGGPKDYDAAVKTVAPGTPLGDVVNAIPELKAQVQQHLMRLLDAKNAGTQAAEFGEKYKAAAAAQQTASKARLGWQAQFVQLKNLPDEKVLPAAENLFNALASEGKITPAQQQQYIEQIRSAAKAVGIKAARDKAVKWGLGLVGAGAATEAGMHAAKVMGQ